LIPPLKNENVNFYGVATSSSMSAGAISKVHGFKENTTDSIGLIKDKSTDIVFIASRHDSHAEYVINSLKNNKSVFVEKPLAITMEELNQIAEVYEKSDAKLMVGFNRRFSKPFNRIKKFIGETGQPIHVAYRVSAGKIPKDHWSQHENQGGRIIGELCHFIDSAMYFTGSTPISVFAESFSGDDISMINNDNVTVTLKMKNGSTAKIDYIANGGKSMPKEYVEVFGSGNSATMNNFEIVNYYSTGSKEEKFNGKKGIDEEVKLTIDSFINGKEAPITFEELYATSKTTIMILESLKLGKKIDL
jgi:polar amino acid transport system substrate-binding protein